MRRRNSCPGLAAGLAAVLLGLAGCAGLSAAPRSPIPDVEATIAAPGGLAANYTPAEVSACLARSVETEATEARACRDRIVQALMTAINLRFAEYEIGFFEANRAVNFGSTLAVLGLGAAGTVSGATAGQAIAAAITGITGTRAAFNREVMLEQTSAALLTAMRVQRNIADLRIRAGLQLPARDYPLGVALTDVYAFFRAGTLPGALAGLTQSVGAENQRLQQELRDALPVARANAARSLQQMVGDPALTPEQRRANRERIRRAMDAEGIPPSVLVSAFVADPAREAQQARVLDRVRAP